MRFERMMAAMLVAVAVLVSSWIIAGGGIAKDAGKLDWQTVDEAQTVTQATEKPADALESYRPAKEDTSTWRAAYTAVEARVTELESRMDELEKHCRCRSPKSASQASIKPGMTSDTPFPGIPIVLPNASAPAVAVTEVILQTASDSYETVCANGTCRRVSPQVARPLQRMWRRY